VAGLTTRYCLLAATTAGMAAAHSASAAPLSVPQIQVMTRNTIRYVCDGGQSLTVRYVNTRNEQSFALLPVQGKNLLFVNVQAGSGAKYSASHYTWWTKGPQGTLSDELADQNAPPLLANCRVRR
jgi:membrane-bound inhibitor of C-type lysozyme